MQENFKALIDALEQADFSSAEINELLELLAGLLHLSNASFVEGQGGLLELQGTAAEEGLQRAAPLLGLELQELKSLLCCRRMKLKNDILLTQRSKQQSLSASGSLIRFVYSRLFDRIVQRLKERTAKQVVQEQRSYHGSSNYKSIGSKHPAACWDSY